MSQDNGLENLVSFKSANFMKLEYACTGNLGRTVVDEKLSPGVGRDYPSFSTRAEKREKCQRAILNIL